MRLRRSHADFVTSPRDWVHKVHKRFPPGRGHRSSLCGDPGGRNQGEGNTIMDTAHNTDEAESVRQLNGGPPVELLGSPTDVHGVSAGGSTVLPFAHTGVPLLDSFHFRFRSQDHHLQTVRIDPDEPLGELTLQFDDKNGDDGYNYNIIHQVVDDARVQRGSVSGNIGSEVDNTVRLQRPAGDFVFVLIGFSLQFRGTDHHINEVRILEFDSILHVRYLDKHDGPGGQDGDEPPPTFLWDVQFAWVPSDLFVELGTASGKDDRFTARRNIAAGPSVIRGFSFDFQSEDHHLTEIGVTTPDDGK